MKLLVPICIVGILLVSGFGAIGEHTNINEQKIENQGITTFTHTMLGEYGTATWCPYCRFAHGALKELYAEGQFPFYYVTLVTDKNAQASQRCSTDYNAYGWPTLWWDGGYRVDVGAGSVAGAKATYTNSLNACGSRAVADIDIDLGVTWLGGTNMEIEATVTNNEASTYGGHIRVYITEIVSSMGWYDYGGQLYTFPFLAYAFNQDLSISGGDSWSDSTTWDGSSHGFPTITEDNIMIIAAVFNDEPHTGYSYPPSSNPFTAYYVDEVVGATPGSGQNNPPDTPRYPNPDNGATDIPVNVDLNWVGGDPDGDDVTYDIYFGTSGQPTKVESNYPDTIYNPGPLTNFTTYYWQIVAFDEHGESTTGPVWSFTTTSNYPPNKPTIAGPASGKPNTQIEYTFAATDPNGDELLYYIDWGDGSTENWVGPYASGENVVLQHSWTDTNTYIIKAKVKDPAGLESDFETLEVSIPRDKTVMIPFLYKIFERFQLSFPLLKQLLR